jgi:hypothetical protein
VRGHTHSGVRQGVLGKESDGHELFANSALVLHAWIDWIEDDLKNRRFGWSVLEFGCDKGINIGYLAWRDPYLASPRWYLQGVDEDPEMVDITITSIWELWRHRKRSVRCAIETSIESTNIFRRKEG